MYLQKYAPIFYFADLAISNMPEPLQSQILHLGLLIDNMNNEIKTLAPYYEVVNTVCNEEIS